VVGFEDETKAIFEELVRMDKLKDTYVATDFFDASINRVAAWVIGFRNLQKALLFALLTPHNELKKCQDSGDFTKMFALSEELKTLPMFDVWEEFCSRNNVPGKNDWYEEVIKYENDVLKNRG
jgi:L-rhamnose isomerase